ncbi:DUF806 family protein [Leuconostoc citreum]|uniref:DUF806 family protein n=1 Tax=Leuconostoc citreum TaxID=33964 RepID=UPI00200AA792|nr:DUF806 family protein [Leuconostoc citreum]MCK8606165.1 DUF806 family protein [Leuconostoc citreum]
MTITMQARALLIKLAPWANEVYPNIIPEEVQAKTDDTIILVRPAFDSLNDYGSDQFNSITNNLSIQIFYATGNELDYDVLEAQLYQDLIHNGYQVTEVKGRLTDIDTYQDYQTFTVTKNRALKTLLPK